MWSQSFFVHGKRKDYPSRMLLKSYAATDTSLKQHTASIGKKILAGIIKCVDKLIMCYLTLTLGALGLVPSPEVLHKPQPVPLQLHTTLK